MQLNEIAYQGQPPVDSYGPGFFRVAGQLHAGAVMLGPDGVTMWQGLAETDLLTGIGTKCDVLLIGMGTKINALPAGLKTALDEKNVAFEIMATPSACRTYNILLAEGRRVVLAALPV